MEHGRLALLSFLSVYRGMRLYSGYKCTPIISALRLNTYVCINTVENLPYFLTYGANEFEKGPR